MDSKSLADKLNAKRSDQQRPTAIAQECLAVGNFVYTPEHNI